MRFSIEQILSWKPCFPYSGEAHLRQLFGGKDVIEHREVLGLNIPAEDKWWGLLNAIAATPYADRDCRLLACECAERVFALERRKGREPDPRNVAAVGLARRVAAGQATEEERRREQWLAEKAVWNHVAPLWWASTVLEEATFALRAAARKAREEAEWEKPGSQIERNAAKEAEILWLCNRVAQYLDNANA